MITVYSDRHRLHHGRRELNDGALVPVFERPERADALPLAWPAGGLRLIEPVEPDHIDGRLGY